MGSPCPPHWTFAARAAYFGERLCAFCEHRNPPGARFCNDCGSPLHLKPCAGCDGVNDGSASYCHQCGAACPVVSPAWAALQASSTAEAAFEGPTAGDEAVAATVTRAPIGASTSPTRPGWRSLASAGLLAAVAMALIVAAYEAYRDNAVHPGRMEVASAPVVAFPNDATRATTSDSTSAESPPQDTEEAASAELGMPAAEAETPRRTAVRRVAPPPPAGTRASGHQRVAVERQVPVRKTTSVSYRAAPVGPAMRVTQTDKGRQADRWQAMHASLAKCGGDVLARMVCDHRVRRHFCAGYWGAVPECASGLANEHGQ